MSLLKIPYETLAKRLPVVRLVPGSSREDGGWRAPRSPLQRGTQMAALKSKMLGANIRILLRRQIAIRIPTTVSRHIFGNNVLAVDAYLQQRERVAIQFHGMRDKFISKMIQHTQSNPTGMVFTEDLKHMIHLVNDNKEELDLMSTMIKIYCQQNSELRFATYTFGPVIMRCLHNLGADELAYQLITEPSLGFFFDQFTSYTVAMDLLWKKEKYLQVVELFELLKNKQLRGSKFPRDAVVLYMAACYKINTAESFKLVCDLIKEANEKEGVLLRKALTFAAALAINQNAPETALEFLTMSPQKNYFTVKNLKVIAMARLDRLSDCLDILKSSLERDVPSTVTQATQFCEETLAAVRSAVERSRSKSETVTFERIVKCLQEEKLMSKDTLDESLCAPVLNKPAPRTDERVSGYESRFFSQSDAGKSRRGAHTDQQRTQDGRRPRPGLFSPD